MNSSLFSPRTVLFFLTTTRAISNKSQIRTLPYQSALVTSSHPIPAGLCLLWALPASPATPLLLLALALTLPGPPASLPVPWNHEVPNSGPSYLLFPLPGTLFPQDSAGHPPPLLYPSLCSSATSSGSLFQLLYLNETPAPSLCN